MTTSAPQSTIRVASASAEKPPNTTVCGAPIRAQASIATTRLGDHRHVDRDPVTGLDTELGQRVGRLADLVLELGVGDRARVVLGLADPVDRDPVAQAVVDVPVDAVVRRVEPAAHEPLGERRVVPVEDPVPLLVPVQPLGLLGPERLPVGRGPLVGLLLEVGVLRQVGRRLEPPVLLHRLDRVCSLTEPLLDRRPRSWSACTDSPPDRVAGGLPPGNPPAPSTVPSGDRLLGAGAGQRADLELGVAVRRLRLLGGDRAQPAEEEAQRDRDDPRVAQREPRPVAAR